MKDFAKKISMALLIVSLGWFPIQATFATSFMMLAGNMPAGDMSVQNMAVSNSELALAFKILSKLKNQ